MEKKIENSRMQLTRLIKQRPGEATYLVKSCIQLPLDAGYDTSMMLSKKQ